MRHLAAAGLLVLCLAWPASAQERPKADLFAGYSLVRQDGASLHGGEVTLAYNLSPHLGLVLDLDGHGRTVEGTDHTTSAALAGARISLVAGGLTPFVHALVGAVRDEDSVKVFSQTISESHTNVGGAAGGGLDFLAGRRFGLRVQADYRLARRTDDRGEKKVKGDPRFSLGVVFRMGRR